MASVFAATFGFYGCGRTPDTKISEVDGVKKISLDGANWTLSFWEQPDTPVRSPSEFKKLHKNSVTTIPATVPGNVELDLLKAGLLKDFTVGAESYKLRKYEGYQWRYTRNFRTPQFMGKQRVIMDFQGIDTLADIYLNGKKVGETDNMLIPHRFDVTNFLGKPGASNRLDVFLRSVVIESAKYDEIFGAGRRERSEFIHIRKGASSFGWDILSRIVSAGLWKGVSLEIQNPVHFDSVNWYTRSINVDAKRASVAVEFKIQTPFRGLGKLKARSTLSRNGEIVSQREITVESYAESTSHNLDSVAFWWPRGMGEPALYDAKVEIVSPEGAVLAANTCKIGVRTVSLECKEGENGNPGKFLFKVNGVPVFMHGTNWVHLDLMHSRDIQHVNKAIAMAVDLNCNMIRCWGGNVYENDRFYDLCDKNGILVWQDFGFGCTPYPQTAEFQKKVYDEVKSVVRRLRNHPCIALWAGNNENDDSLTWKTGDANRINPDYDVLSRKVIPQVLADLDWSRPYLPSSPYISGKVFENPKVYASSEQHLWGPRGYYKAGFYTHSPAVFVSEIGYHGCPNKSSLEKMFHKEFVYPWVKDKDGKYQWNKEWQAKAVMQYENGGSGERRNDVMGNQTRIVFGAIPRNLDDFIFASQAIQGEAKKYFIEMMRTQMFEPKTGILWWNLIDGWPIISDAVVDFYGSKKLAYEYIKRVQQNCVPMINDNFELIAANGTLGKMSGTVKVRDVDSKKVLFDGKFEVGANSKNKIAQLEKLKGQGMLVIEYKIDGQSLSKLNHYLYGWAPFKLDDYKRWFKALKIYPEA